MNDSVGGEATVTVQPNSSWNLAKSSTTLATPPVVG
jgi:hypothetical protein